MSLTFPFCLAPGGPTGSLPAAVLIRPASGSPDVEQTLDDSVVFRHGAIASQPPVHTTRFYLHRTDVPPTAGGFTMNQTPAPSLLQVSLVDGPRWFSVPSLVGTFDAGAQFRVVIPCVLGIGAGTRYTLAHTAPDGAARRRGNAALALHRSADGLPPGADTARARFGA